MTVAVVGAGLSGCAAVIALARRGIQATWLAGQGTRVEPFGETLAPAAGAILDSLGIRDVLDDDRHRASVSTFSSWGSDTLQERNAALALTGTGFVLDRPAFEAAVFTRAQELCEPIRTRVVGIAGAGEAWSLGLADGRSHLARFVVDATGRHASIGRRLSRRSTGPRLLAVTTMTGEAPSDVEPTRATMIEAMPDGWIYAAVRSDRRLCLGYFTSPASLPRGITRQAADWGDILASSAHVSRWIADVGFALGQPTVVRDASVAWLGTPAGTAQGGRCGWAAIGDAAAAFDPLSSHGMTSALWMGERMGAVAHGFIEGDPAFLSDYASAVARGVDAFIRARRMVYASEIRFADRPFWASAAVG